MNALVSSWGKFSSNNLASETREILSSFAKKDGEWDAVMMAERYPKCACELAKATSNGHGPVLDEETLRLFIVSRFNFDLKNKPKLTQAMFNNVFKRGASTYRLEKASKAELELSAQILYDEAKNADAYYGGIVGVLDFPARHAKYHADDTDDRLMCVLDTPLPKRPSHCDLVTAIAEPEDRTAWKAKLFNQVRANDFVRSVDITDCDLLKFRPVALLAA